MHRILQAFLGLVIVLQGCYAKEDTTTLVTPLPYHLLDFADLAKKVSPAVVNISSTTEMKIQRRFPPFPPGTPFDDFFRQFLEDPQWGSRPKLSTSLGSGFIIDQEGDDVLVVTCHHVVADADDVRVSLYDGEKIDAVVLATDRRTDLALIKFKTARKMTVAKWGSSSKAKVGQWVLAVGNPFGFQNTVTHGIISALERDIGTTNDRGLADYVSNYIQTNASINSGNSGGPLFNVYGEVVAVCTSIFSPNGGNIGIGFGIPSDLSMQVIEQLRQYGRTKRGWLGVTVQNVTPEIAQSLGLGKPRGALVVDVTKTGPGKKAGLKTGDVILSFENQNIDDSRHLPRLVGQSKIGSRATVLILRDGKERKIAIDVGEYEQAEDQGLIHGPSEKKVPRQQNYILGMMLKAPNADLCSKYGLCEDIKGLLIISVDPSSEAASRGFRPGDIIIEVSYGGQKIKPASTESFEKVIQEARKKGQHHVLILVNRKGNLRFMTLNLDENKKKYSRER